MLECAIRGYAIDPKLAVFFNRFLRQSSRKYCMSERANGLLPNVYRIVDPAVRDAIVPIFPRNVFIEVTNRCNLLCTTCPHTFTAYEPLKTLGWHEFIRIVDQFPQIERAVLHGIGEPLLNKELPRMIALLKARGATVLFNTNATLLSEDLAQKLVNSGLDELRVSLDSLSPEIYLRIRGAPSLDKVIANLKGLSQVQRELQVDYPRVSLWMMGMKGNIHELPDLVRLAAQLGIPDVYLQRLVYHAHESHSPEATNADRAIFSTHNADIDRIIDEAESVARTLKVGLHASGATTAKQSIQKSRERTPWLQCVRPWTTAYVTVNGNALPCCISPFATLNYQSLILGNVFDQTFGEIWNAGRYQEWRRRVLGEQPHEACAGCGTLWSL
jgi:MoaA/NifB/PqqE/SkfB family radical SAM enzyme